MESRISNSASEIESLHKLIASLQGKNRELLEQNSNLSFRYQGLSNQNIELSKQNSALLKKNTELLERINKLEEQLKLLKAKRFGKSSEKLERQIVRWPNLSRLKNQNLEI